MKIGIIGTGAYCPKVVKDEEYIRIYGKKAMAISKLLTHHSRFLATDIDTLERKITNTEMALEASKVAIANADLQANDIDMIIYSTVTPDYVVPACYTILQEKLQIKNCKGLDLRSGCAGFGTAMNIAETYIRAGKVKNVLVVGADLLSTRFTEIIRNNKNISMKFLFNYMFFGDGAGALVMSELADDSKGIYYSDISSDKADKQYGSIIEVGGSNLPYMNDEIKSEDSPIRQVSGVSDIYLTDVLIETMKQVQMEGISLEDIDVFIMPVESKKIKENVIKEFPQITKNKIFSVGSEGGAMINAAIPIAIHKALERNVIRKKMRVLIYAAENTKWQHAITILEW